MSKDKLIYERGTIAYQWGEMNFSINGVGIPTLNPRNKSLQDGLRN